MTRGFFYPAEHGGVVGHGRGPADSGRSPDVTPPTLLTYVALSTRGSKPWRPDAVSRALGQG